MNNLICKQNPKHIKLRPSKENPGFYMCDICKDGWKKEELELQATQSNNQSQVNQFLFRLYNLSDENNREHCAFLQISDFLMQQLINIRQDLKKYPNLMPHISIQSTKLDFNSSLKIITLSDMNHTNTKFNNVFNHKNWYRFSSKNQFFIPNSVTSYSEIQVEDKGIEVFGSYGSYWLDTNLFESLNLTWSNLGV